MDNLKLPHRDDMDPELLEVIEKMFAEMHPGMKVVFAGDLPGAPDSIPEELKQNLEAVRQKFEDDFVAGKCTDCGEQIPDWEARMNSDDDDYFLPEGWGLLTAGENASWWANPPRLLCPPCNKLDEERQGPTLEPLDG